MRATFVATLKMLARTPSMVIWGLAFPIIMATIFLFMFSGFANDGVIDRVPVALVADDAWSASPFAQVVDTLAEGDEPLLDLHETATTAEAEALLAAGDVDGIFTVIPADGRDAAAADLAAALADLPADGRAAAAGALGTVELTVAPESSAAHGGGRDAAYSINRSILEAIASSYTQTRALLFEVARENPAALADPATLIAVLGAAAPVERVSLTRSEPDETVRYYYALLGMATLFAAQLAMYAVAVVRPTAAAVAARRSVAGVSRLRQLVGAVAASWVLAFAFLTAAFVYLVVVVGIDFAGREPLCLAGLAAGAALATGIGALVGALPLKGGPGAGSGLLTALTCLLSIFAGLYGSPAMALADEVARVFPVSTWINPCKLVCDTFYSLYYYESLAPFAARLAACLVWGLVFLAVAAPLFRRQRYAHL